VWGLRHLRLLTSREGGRWRATDRSRQEWLGENGDGLGENRDAKIGTGYLSQKRRSENRDGLLVAKEEEGGLRNFEDFIVEAIENRDRLFVARQEWLSENRDAKIGTENRDRKWGQAICRKGGGEARENRDRLFVAKEEERSENGVENSSQIFSPSDIVRGSW
jgi:hypothetical protein